MDVTIIVALISGLCVAIPTIVATIVQNKSHDAVTDERIKNMEIRAEERQKAMNAKFSEISSKLDRYCSEHNSLMERIAVVERDTKNLFERIDEIMKEIRKPN